MPTKTPKTTKEHKPKESETISKGAAPEIVLITKDANLGEVVFKYPEATEVLTDYGLHCVGCFASSFDTIEMGAKVHGMDDDEIAEMIERVNEAIFFKE